MARGSMYAAMSSIGFTAIRCSAAFLHGSRRWRACFLWRKWKRRCDREPGPGGEDRRSGAVRGIYALSLSPLFCEEPAAVELRRSVSSFLLRAAARDRTRHDADGT